MLFSLTECNVVVDHIVRCTCSEADGYLFCSS